MTAINDEIEEAQRLAREQEALATGERLTAELEADEEAIFQRAREAQEAELAQLPEKYQGKSAAEVYALMQKEVEYRLKQAKGEEPADEAQEDQEGASEQSEGESQETEETPAFQALREASEEFYASEGKLTPETLQKLEALPSADLIQAWQALQAQAPPAKPLSDEEATAIVNRVGGQDAYNKALAWAAENLSEEDKASYDAVVQSGNKAATQFAVEALTTRYKQAVGFDGEPVTGAVAKAPKVKAYRSEAELRRDLSNPRYQQDPAFRLDVEERLAVSGDLL
jgi:hypothetical protein